MIPKREKNTDIATDIAQGKMLKKRIIRFAEEAAKSFLNSGEGLNETVAAIAKRERLNRLQIQRLVEEANTVAYSKKYETVKGEQDRRISFELAEQERVLEEMGSDAPEFVDNPNWVTGRPGEGEIKKEASDASSTIESSPIHKPYGNIDAKRQKLREKQAAQEIKEYDKTISEANREMSSYLTKAASALVRSEQLHKNANQIYNTILDDMEWDETFAEALEKRASEVSERLAENGRIHSRSMVSLKREPQEKVANAMFGSHSLVHEKQADESTKIEKPKVAPTSDVDDYQQLITMAKRIQENQRKAKQAEQAKHKLEHPETKGEAETP